MIKRTSTFLVATWLLPVLANVLVVALIFGATNAKAQTIEVGAECAALFAATGAVPGTPSCWATAWGAQSSLSTFYCVTTPARARAWCGGSPKLVGVFNGVFNSQRAANAIVERSQQVFGTQYRDSPLRYDLFYNTGCSLGITTIRACLTDLVETFEQRSAEAGPALATRWELFWAAMGQQGPRNAGGIAGLAEWGNAVDRMIQLSIDTAPALVAGQVTDAIVGLGGIVGRIRGALIDQTVVSTKFLLSLSPPTAADVSRHLEQLRSWFGDGTVSGAVFLAHSQGNLFANAAYRGFKAGAPLVRLRVAHVAPASPTLNGEYLLADIDAVINGLRATNVPVLPNNLVLPLSSNDLSGHTFDGTYLDPSRAGLEATKQLMERALAAIY